MTNETNLFIKICISHDLFSKRLMFLWCVRDEWRQGQTAILTNFFSWPWHAVLSSRTHLALLPHLSWSCSTGDRWGPQPSVCKLVLTLVFLSPTNSTAAGVCLYSFITPTCFCFFTLLHLWLTVWSRVNIQHYLTFLSNLTEDYIYFCSHLSSW